MIKIKMAQSSGLKGIFFDYGGVLEDLEYGETTVRRGVEVLHALLSEREVHATPGLLFEMLNRGQEEYSRWYLSHDYKELPNEEMWSSFFLKDLCIDPEVNAIVQGISEELSSIFEFYLYKRRPVKEVRTVLKKLFYSGYTLAIVSNTISRTLIPERLSKYGIADFFSKVFLSVKVGVRKPSAEIFQMAIKSMDLDPNGCMFVGDTLSRDVEGARNAGFGSVVLMPSALTDLKDRGYSGEAKPDHTLDALEGMFALLS
jgi:putative hydrolase of the HAD superfamily